MAPDSTTDRQVFNSGEDILLHGKDGLFYFGTVIQVSVLATKKNKPFIFFLIVSSLCQG